jgi:hypothetical protein
MLTADGMAANVAVLISDNSQRLARKLQLHVVNKPSSHTFTLHDVLPPAGSARQQSTLPAHITMSITAQLPQLTRRHCTAAVARSEASCKQQQLNCSAHSRLLHLLVMGPCH